MKKLLIAFILSTSSSLFCFGQSLEFKINDKTGGISNLGIKDDVRKMNWLVETDGSQYPGVTAKYCWGLGYFSIEQNGKKENYKWGKSPKIEDNGRHIQYKLGDIQINVFRNLENGDFVEQYKIENTGNNAVSLTDIGIFTPFNDNYPGATICLTARTHTHIWDGGNAAFINATHMSGKAPHLGLIVTEGEIIGYDVFERDLVKYSSDFRGIFAMKISDQKLKPKESKIFSWRLFKHSGWNDFQKKIVERGNIFVQANKYIFKKDEQAELKIYGDPKLMKSAQVSLNGSVLKITKGADSYVVRTSMSKIGESRFEITYGNGMHTHVDCKVFDDFEELLSARTDFIIDKQQMNKPTDRRYGAYMVYDNETNEIYLNNTKNANPPDRDEGAERVGMGVFLAKEYLKNKDEKIKESLLRYAKFIRERLQDKAYKTWSSVGKNGRNRGYNYVWISEFYFLMYKITNDKQYAIDGYQTLRSMFRQFGRGFYAIGYPLQIGLDALQETGLNSERELLLDDFIKLGNNFIANGLNYPAHEVKYEQSIVAPAVTFLCQLYLVTKDDKYLEEAKKQLPALEAFSGHQPSHHLNEISIRHWDGYWFGKSEMWGDVFPHYWSVLTGVAYHYYAKCTGDRSYQDRAENIARNNLSLFTEDGRASCAYIYPDHVDGRSGRFYDVYANDQDWALCYYLDIMK